MNSMIPELESYIAFRLGQLGERNEHHEFEAIATRIARKRISANILVANGPVSAGGDQQRDGESFTTSIPLELPNAAGFSASASTKPTVIACTVQKTGLKSKVLSDLEGICSEGAAPVELVAFFSVTSIAESVTHDLQKMARENYGVVLDVYSGMKIATILAEPDLVWVAQHYLQVASSMVPIPDGDTAPAWYNELLHDLRRNNGPAALTRATQGEISEGLRYATFDSEANSDLPEWLDFMSAFLNSELPGDLVFRARYEICVGRFRGMGAAGVSEELVRHALKYARSVTSQAILDDAATLVLYWGNMWIAGVAGATATEIAYEKEFLRAHIVAQLDVNDDAQYPVRAASLTGTLAYLHFQPQWDLAEANGLRPEKSNVAAHAGERLEPISVEPAFAEQGVINLGAAMLYLDQLVDLLPRARPYSISSLARIFNMFAPVLATDVNYIKVRDALDASASAVQGDAAVAERCRDRAMAFMKAGNPLEALAEMHTAKVHWFHGDLMYGAALATRYIGKIYSELGLSYAAKMYACVAVTIASQSPARDLQGQVPSALFEAAQSAHMAGCWVDAAAFSEVALLAHNSLASHAFDTTRHPELASQNANELMALLAIRAFWPDLEVLLRNAHPKTDWYEDLAEQASSPEAKMPYDEDEFQGLAGNQFHGPVLSDLGPHRVIDFAALGVRWLFTFENTHDSVLAAEGFVAAFQVFLADAARFHPVIIRSEVQVSISVNPGEDGLLVQQSGEVIVAQLTLSASASELDALSRSLVATSLQLLAEVHARPPADLMLLLDSMMRGGITHKVLSGRPYAEAADFLSSNHYEKCAESKRPESSDSFVPAVHESLASSTRQGSGYDKSHALERIERRYSAAESWRLSFDDFVADRRGLAAIKKLQEDGWRDWQILMTFQNVGLNWRARREPSELSSLTSTQMYELATRPEKDSDSRVPVDFVLDHLDENLLIQTITVARSWGVQSSGEQLGSGNLRDLLTRRYSFAVDDIPHPGLLIRAEDA